MRLFVMKGDRGKMPEYRNDRMRHLILFVRFKAAEIGGQI